MTYVIGVKRAGVSAIIADMRVTHGHLFRVGSNDALKSGILFPGCIFGISGSAQRALDFIDRAQQAAIHAASISQKWTVFSSFASKYNTAGFQETDHFEVILASRASGQTELFLYKSNERTLAPSGSYISSGSGRTILGSYVQGLNEAVERLELEQQISPALLPAVYCLGLTTMVTGWDRSNIEQCGVGGAFYYHYQTASAEDHQPPAVFAIAFGNHDGSSIATSRVRIAFVKGALIVHWPNNLLCFGNSDANEILAKHEGLRAIFADIQKSGDFRGALHSRDFPELNVANQRAALDTLSEKLAAEFNLIDDYKFCGLGFGGLNEIGSFICQERRASSDVFGVGPASGELVEDWKSAIKERYQLRQRFPGEDQQTDFYVIPSAADFLENQLRYPLDRLEVAFSHPDQCTLTTSQGGTIRLAWFEDNTGLLYVGKPSDTPNSDGGLRINVEFAVPICLCLPAKEINRETRLNDVMSAVLESFGVPISAHPDNPPILLYEGPFNKKDLRLGKVEGDPDIFVFGIGSEREKVNYAELLLALNDTKYRAWYQETLKPILSAEPTADC